MHVRGAVSFSAAPHRRSCATPNTAVVLVKGRGISVIYLASPYQHQDKTMMQRRFHDVCAATAWLMARGEIIYSPIAHNHYLACNFDFPRDWEFWQRYDLAILKRADELWVLELDGWHKSVGVAAEITFAINNEIPVVFIALEEVGLRG